MKSYIPLERVFSAKLMEPSQALLVIIGRPHHHRELGQAGRGTH
jgi:hypothetical protein